MTSSREADATLRRAAGPVKGAEPRRTGRRVPIGATRREEEERIDSGFSCDLLLKKVKRVGNGFGNFPNYRLPPLLHCGVEWQTQQTARLQDRSPRLVA
jgi:hypothetical protein